jgi:hypothetical protein
MNRRLGAALVLAALGLGLPSGARAGCDADHLARLASRVSSVGLDALLDAGGLRGVESDPGRDEPPPCLAGSCRGDSPAPAPPVPLIEVETSRWAVLSAPPPPVDGGCAYGPVADGFGRPLCESTGVFHPPRGVVVGR